MQSDHKTTLFHFTQRDMDDFDRISIISIFLQTSLNEENVQEKLLPFSFKSCDQSAFLAQKLHD